MTKEETQQTVHKKQKYFDKRDPEEESIFEFHEEEVQDRYENLEHFYNQIISNKNYENAKSRSIGERERLGIKEDDNFVYGEMTFRSLSYIYETIKKTYGVNCLNQGNFYDLGSVTHIIFTK